MFCRGETPAFDKAVGLLTKRANEGHPDSMTELGQRMYYGDKMDRDKAGGLDMLCNAAKDGSYIAHYILGAILVGDDDDAVQQHDELLQSLGVDKAPDGLTYYQIKKPSDLKEGKNIISKRPWVGIYGQESNWG